MSFAARQPDTPGLRNGSGNPLGDALQGGVSLGKELRGHNINFPR